MIRQFQTILSIFFLILLLNACQKSPGNADAMTAQSQLIQQAKEFFDQQTLSSGQSLTGNPRLDAIKKPAWSSAYCVPVSRGTAVVVPVVYQKKLVVTSNFDASQTIPLSQLAQLVIYPDSAGYKMELVTAFPDSSIQGLHSGLFSGIVFVETWQGKSLAAYKYSGADILRRQPVSGAPNSTVTGTTTDAAKAPASIIETCFEISGYNYSPDDPDGGYSWTESAGCSYQYVRDDGGGSGGNGGGGGLSGGGYGSIASHTSLSLRNPKIVSGPNIIGNVQNYFGCFNNVGGNDHIYTVTLCVDQPVPGTRQAWGYADGATGTSATNNPFDVGHTFLIFSETAGGSTITRNVGFYPRTVVDPFAQSDQGQLNDNESSGYNISLTINIDNAQFFNMLNYISQGNNPGYMYNLNSNNCTTFVIDALQAGSVNLSTQIGVWLNGSGYDPGDLGEDIRTMPLASNMTRNTVDNPHPNVGTCY